MAYNYTSYDSNWLSIKVFRLHSNNVLLPIERNSLLLSRAWFLLCDGTDSIIVIQNVQLKFFRQRSKQCTTKKETKAPSFFHSLLRNRFSKLISIIIHLSLLEFIFVYFGSHWNLFIIDDLVVITEIYFFLLLAKVSQSKRPIRYSLWYCSLNGHFS